MRKIGSSAKYALTALAALVVAAGLVLGSGIFLASIDRTQLVSTVEITTDPAGGSLAWPGKALGKDFAFSVTVANDAGSDYTVHLELSVDCPAGGKAMLKNVNGWFAGELDICPSGAGLVETSSVLIRDGDDFTWLGFVVKYLDVADTYTWTIAAHE